MTFSRRRKKNTYQLKDVKLRVHTIRTGRFWPKVFLVKTMKRRNLQMRTLARLLPRSNNTTVLVILRKIQRNNSRPWYSRSRSSSRSWTKAGSTNSKKSNFGRILLLVKKHMIAWIVKWQFSEIKVLLLHWPLEIVKIGRCRISLICKPKLNKRRHRLENTIVSVSRSRIRAPEKPSRDPEPPLAADIRSPRSVSPSNPINLIIELLLPQQLRVREWLRVLQLWPSPKEETA